MVSCHVVSHFRSSDRVKVVSPMYSVTLTFLSVTDTYIGENRSLIQSLTLMRSATTGCDSIPVIHGLTYIAIF